jgi:hypothetical protein
MKDRNSRTKWLVRTDLFAFVPLLIFLGVTNFHPADFPARWAYAYFYTFVPALVFTAIAIAVFPACGKLWLGTNAWFAVLGALTVLKAWPTLELLGKTFQESGGFVTTAAICCVTAAVSPGSLIGAPALAVGEARRHALLLVGAAVVGAAVSYLMQGTRLLSITLPVVLFVGATWYMRRNIRRRLA